MNRLLALAGLAGLAWVLLGDSPQPAVADQSSLSDTFTQSEIEDLRQLNADDYAGEGFQPGTRAAMVEQQNDDYELGQGVTGL